MHGDHGCYSSWSSLPGADLTFFARFFLMRLDREMNDAAGYLLALYTGKYGILVHAACVQGSGEPIIPNSLRPLTTGVSTHGFRS